MGVGGGKRREGWSSNDKNLVRYPEGEPKSFLLIQIRNAENMNGEELLKSSFFKTPTPHIS